MDSIDLTDIVLVENWKLAYKAIRTEHEPNGDIWFDDDLSDNEFHYWSFGYDDPKGHNNWELPDDTYIIVAKLRVVEFDKETLEVTCYQVVDFEDIGWV